MGILDEAIREHLELKRQHGADDSELKQLEDDAFGPPERPGASEPADAASEAATEFMQQPDLGGDGKSEDAEARTEAEEAQAPPPARREPVADVQEAPEPVAEVQEAPEPVADAPEEPAAPDPAGDELGDGPAEEEQPAEEHEAVPSPAGHTTAERHAIADQPTEMYDVEQEFVTPGAESRAPDDEDLAAEEETEPRLGPAEPIAEPDLEDDEDDDFFDEQRLSDELDQALEAPAEPDSEEYEPASNEHEQDAGEAEKGREAESEEGERPAAPVEDEDLLDDTPDFLEESPEDDQLWFEQKPPKDFDFDD
jgi:hypothetical protein